MLMLKIFIRVVVHPVCVVGDGAHPVCVVVHPVCVICHGCVVVRPLSHHASSCEPPQL